MASKDTHTAEAPGDEPPSYQAATSTGGTTASRPTQSSHLEVPGAKNGIPHDRRRSMEDELRPLPPGWIRQFDAKEGHQFFVDTKTDPPRSIRVHPHDDEQYLSTLSSEERERIQEAEEAMHRPLTPVSIDEKPHRDGKLHKPSESYPSDLPARPGQSTQGGKKPLSERLKDKVTGTTKEERARERAERAVEERRYYEAHMKFRQALRQSQITGMIPIPDKSEQANTNCYRPTSAYGQRRSRPRHLSSATPKWRGVWRIWRLLKRVRWTIHSALSSLQRSQCSIRLTTWSRIPRSLR